MIQKIKLSSPFVRKIQLLITLLWALNKILISNFVRADLSVKVIWVSLIIKVFVLKGHLCHYVWWWFFLFVSQILCSWLVNHRRHYSNEIWILLFFIKQKRISSSNYQHFLRHGYKIILTLLNRICHFRWSLIPRIINHSFFIIYCDEIIIYVWILFFRTRL